MSSKSNKVNNHLPTLNPNLIRDIVTTCGINKKNIFDFILGLIEEVIAKEDPEKIAIEYEEYEITRRQLESAFNRTLNLSEDDSRNDELEMPEELPLQIITEQPTTETTEVPPSYAEVIAGKRKKYIN